MLSLGLLLVFGFAHLLGGGGSDGSQPGAQLAGDVHASTPSPSPTLVGPQSLLAASPSHQKGKHQPKSTPTPTVALAAPDGECAADDISAAPKVQDAHAGQPITIDVLLTATRPACTFKVSAKTLAVKVTSGKDSIWSSQDCPRSVPRESVVVRSAVPAVVPVTWSGRRSNGSCSSTNHWAGAGYYHALAAAIGSEPADVQFGLSVPPRAVVTKTAHPKPKKHTKDVPNKGVPKKDVHGKESSCGGDNATC